MISSIPLSSTTSMLLDSLTSMDSTMKAATTRLTTGRKVNSANDDPGVFFQAQSLTMRATSIDSLSGSLKLATKALTAASNTLDTMFKQLDGLNTMLKAAQAAGSGPLQATAMSTMSFGSSASNLVGADRTSSSNFHDGDVFSISLAPAGGSPQTLYFRTVSQLPNTNGSGTSTASPIAVKSVADLQTALKGFNFGTDGSGNALAVNATIDSGRLTLNASADMTIKLESNAAGTAVNDVSAMFNGAMSKTTGANNTATFSMTTLGTSGIKQRQAAYEAYQNAIAQLATLASDGGVNGSVNLLQADKNGAANGLNVALDEAGTSTLKIQLNGSSDAAGLGLSSSYDSRFMLDGDADAAWKSVQSAMDTIRARQASIGSNQSLLNNRMEFNNSMSKLLVNTADELTASDTNADSNQINALQTRQQLAIKVLSLNNQRDQMMLGLL